MLDSKDEKYEKGIQFYLSTNGIPMQYHLLYILS